MPELYLENGEKADLHDVVVWWLAHYEGLEHATEGGTTSPETWYTVNTILRRALTKIETKTRN
jgi:hypothetical protein